ncbi:hypothetical protein C0416_04980 [bacterium]|nr:hypothetical protein [bacterium]
MGIEEIQSKTYYKIKLFDHHHKRFCNKFKGMICASVKKNPEKLADLPKQYDIVEVWGPSFVPLIRLLQKPVILKVADCDLVDENLNVDYIDYDISMDVSVRPKGAKLIISYHNPDHTPSLNELHGIVRDMLAMGADICKIVTKAVTVEDNLIPLRLLAESKTPMIAFCLGEKGRISRIMAPQFGSLISYVPPTADFVTAEGQIVFDEWMKIQKMLARG